jgi:hypothetical protein
MRLDFTISWTLLLSLVSLLCAGCTAEAPLSPPKPPLELIGEWGVSGDGPGQLKSPTAIATDRVGNVYVSDAGSRFVHKFDARGRPLLSFQDERMKDPRAIALDRGGAIYVFDFKRRSVLIFLPDGTWFREIRSSRAPLKGPCDIAVDDEGNIFVLDRIAHRILKFSVQGRVLKSWGKRGSGPGDLAEPGGIAIGPDGAVYVANSFFSRILKFSRDGELLAAWGRESPRELHNPSLAVSSRGVIVVDFFGAAEFWTLDGKLQFAIELLRSHPLSRLPAPPLPPPPPPPPPRVFPGCAWLFPDQLVTTEQSTPRVLRFRLNF